MGADLRLRSYFRSSSEWADSLRKETLSDDKQYTVVHSSRDGTRQTRRTRRSASPCCRRCWLSFLYVQFPARQPVSQEEASKPKQTNKVVSGRCCCFAKEA